jgi:hypothetical protein
MTNWGRRCPLLAQSGHEPVHCTCPLSGVKRTCPVRKSAFAVAIGGKADMTFCGANVRL